MESMQINMRMSKDLAARIDKKRIALSDNLQRIPSRTDVIKMALDCFLDDGGEVKDQPKLGKPKIKK